MVTWWFGGSWTCFYWTGLHMKTASDATWHLLVILAWRPRGLNGYLHCTSSHLSRSRLRAQPAKAQLRKATCDKHPKCRTQKYLCRRLKSTAGVIPLWYIALSARAVLQLFISDAERAPNMGGMETNAGLTFIMVRDTWEGWGWGMFTIEKSCLCCR